MDLRTYAALRDEVTKIARSIDAGMRRTLADRRGEEYLPGGELPEDHNQTEPPEKTAYQRYSVGIPGTENAQGNSSELSFQMPETRGEFHDAYKKYREPAGAALKGGFAGTFLGNMLTAGRLGNANWKQRLGLRGFGILGAGAGMADYFASGDYNRFGENISSPSPVPTPAPAPVTKVAVMGSRTFTPGRQLSQARQVGSFQDKVLHKGSTSKPLSIGHKFKVATGASLSPAKPTLPSVGAPQVGASTSIKPPPAPKIGTPSPKV